jgi:hypothetical protein
MIKKEYNKALEFFNICLEIDNDNIDVYKKIIKLSLNSSFNRDFKQAYSNAEKAFKLAEAQIEQNDLSIYLIYGYLCRVFNNTDCLNYCKEVLNYFILENGENRPE